MLVGFTIILISCALAVISTCASANPSGSVLSTGLFEHTTPVQKTSMRFCHLLSWKIGRSLGRKRKWNGKEQRNEVNLVAGGRRCKAVLCISYWHDLGDAFRSMLHLRGSMGCSVGHGEVWRRGSSRTQEAERRNYGVVARS